MAPKRLVLILIVALTSTTITKAQTLMPGSPCPDQAAGPCDANGNPIGGTPTTATSFAGTATTIVLPNDPGVVPLRMFVVPGDVVLFETSPGSLGDQKTWSDVVEFSDPPTGGTSIATTFADAEPVGILLPPGFSLSANAQGLAEITTGQGLDSTDFTTYIAGNNIYQIHSDCSSAGCEASEPPETPEPATITLLGLGLAALRFGRSKTRRT